eukprot:418617_1
MAAIDKLNEVITLIDDPEQTKDDNVPNEVSSFSVENLQYNEIINKLSSILSSYSSEIDFKVNTDKNTITDGIVFISNYYCIFFEINVVKQDNNSSKIEFQRESGDDIAAAKFLGDIKSRFLDDKTTDSKEEKDSDKQENALIDLELNLNGLEEVKVNEKDKEMMMVHEALIKDQFLGDSNYNNENEENYLYNKLIEKKVINANEITDHKILCQKLMNKNLLLHKDIAIIRASLLILKQFVDVYTDLFLNDDKVLLFGLLNELFKTQKYGLIKKYAIELLAELAKIKDKDWKLDDVLKGELNKLIKEFDEESKNSKYYQVDMFKIIYEKL